MRASFFFFNDTATTEIYTLSLHDALPICWSRFRALPSTGTSIGLSSTRCWTAGFWPSPSCTTRSARRSAEVERSEEHTSELQSPCNLVCRLLLEKKNNEDTSDRHCRAQHL